MAYEVQDRNKFSQRLGSPEGYAGYGLCDPKGRKIGRIKRIFVNDYDEPEYIEVKMGPFGLQTALIPVADVVVNEEQKALVLQ